VVQIKIYPSTHSIEIINESRFDTELKIPLAYINIDTTQYELNKYIEPDFTKFDANKDSIMIPILPYEEVQDTSRLVFNKHGEVADVTPFLKEQEDKKIFVPVHDFVPYNFSYKVTAKKRMVYNTNNNYNINVACIDDSDSLDLSMRLSQIFSTPGERGLITNNIHFNNDQANESTLINLSYEEADFVFLDTYDGKYLDEAKTEEAMVNNYLDNCVNVWVGCTTHHQYKVKAESLGYATFTKAGAFKEFEIKRPLISSNKFVKSDVFFNMSRAEFLNQTGKIFYNIFTSELSPVLIIEHLGKGFEIISHSDVLKNPKEHKDLIYEVMMYVHLISYKRSARVDEWISHNVPDYEVVNGKLYSKTSFTSSRSLDEILGLSYNDYNIYQIDIYDNNKELPMPTDDLVNLPNIEYVDIVNNKLIFAMDKSNNLTYTEVEKPVGWTSIYYKNKIYYIDQIYYHIESDITNKLFVIDNVDKTDSLEVKLYPFKSSKHNINLLTDLSVTISNVTTDYEEADKTRTIKKVANETYLLYIDKPTMKLCYEVESLYESNDNHVVIALLEIKQAEDSTFLTDMRQLGGGLKNETKEDYNLLDMGHINGRPYRKSNTLIITMPKKYEQYKDKIMDALEKYKVGEDYPILFFEDEQE
jgi:hypothetical protein